MNPNREKEILEIVNQVVEEGPYKPTWDSLMEAPVPKWFQEQKLGIFIHWGVYSVPAFGNEWYSRNMYIPEHREFQHHIDTFGPHKEFGYKDFIPMFTAKEFDPKEWLDLFREAGAGYIFPVAEHHDGFQMYGSELSDWNAEKMGPHRDIIGDLCKEAEEHDIMFCTSSHRAEHWFFMSHGKDFDSDIKEPMKKGDFYWPAMEEQKPDDLFSKPYPTEEYLNDWLARTAEIILKYQPKLLYFDWWIQHQVFKPYLKKLAAFYYNCGKKWGQDVLICYKHDAFAFGTGIVEVERGGFAEAKPYPWQTDTAVARNSWCYTEDLDYKSSEEIIWTLVDVVSKNGNLLLNIGPKGDGSIPDGDRKILKELGAWMKVNKEALIGAKTWRKSQEGPTKSVEGQFQDQQAKIFTSEDYRFTANHGAIYAICMKCPKDGKFTIKALADSADQNAPEFHGIIENIQILGFEDKAYTWTKDTEGLHVNAPEVYSEFPVVLKIITE